MEDAWKQYFDLQKRYMREWQFRDDLVVFADGLNRGVKINGEQHNVGTIQAFIACLQAACAFVEDANPDWSRGRLHPLDIAEYICGHGHRTFAIVGVVWPLCNVKIKGLDREFTRCGERLERVEEEDDCPD
jgi:hypothetical protein